MGDVHLKLITAAEFFFFLLSVSCFTLRARAVSSQSDIFNQSMPLFSDNRACRERVRAAAYTYP